MKERILKHIEALSTEGLDSNMNMVTIWPYFPHDKEMYFRSTKDANYVYPTSVKTVIENSALADKEEGCSVELEATLVNVVRKPEHIEAVYRVSVINSTPKESKT